ncbi:MAG TPA: protein kinase [Ktedonosporobacter sp.]|nr:protein kinase [Ktedonosporobacter sp.]
MNATPRHLGKYELQQQLGRGSVGEVWKAYDTELRRDVAIKILHTDLQSDPHFLTRFTTEGATIASLHHSNIVQVHDAAITRSPESNETTAYIVMDYIEGKTLADFISATSHQGEFPPVAQIVYLFTSLCVAVDYAHQNGVIHGNIKPENILLNQRDHSRFQAGEPLLTDFGFPLILDNTTGVGTPHYMSPEQAQGDAPNKRSDIYALGVALYEICTGVKPFRDESSVAVMMQHINTLPTPPILINSHIPPALSEVILRAMAKETATRFALASLLAAAIADACSMQPLPRITAAQGGEGEYSPYHPMRLGAQASILGVSQPLINDIYASAETTGQPTRMSPHIPEAPRPIVSAPLPPLTGAPNWSASALPTVANTMAVSPTTYKIPATPPPVQESPANIPSRISAPLQPGPFSVAAQATGAMMPVQNNPQGMTSGPRVSLSPRTSVPLPPLPAPGPIYAQGPMVAPPMIAPPPPFRGKARQSFRDTPILIIIISLVLLLVIIIGAIFAINKGQPNQTAMLGHVFFQDDALGHEDQLRLEMPNVAAPPNGTSYFAWLKTTDQQSLPLGQLTLKNGNISFLYPGDNKHTNLLSIAQGVFITQETTDSNPHTPANKMVYQALFTTATFQYIKNILYSTPNFPDNRGVISGLLETIKSMNDKAGSVVDTMQGNHDYDLSRRQTVRIIEMIDGTSFAQSNNDLPANDPPLLHVQLGLLSSPTQQGYIDTLATQIDQLKQTAANNSSLLQHIQNIQNAINDLRDWVQKIRSYAVQILKAVDLRDPAIISVALQLKQTAADSYTGHVITPGQDAQSTAGSAGAIQAYIEAQYLATLDIQAV